MSLFIGAYAVVNIPPLKIETKKKECSLSNLHHIVGWETYCPICGCGVVQKSYPKTIPASLRGLNEIGLLPTGKYREIKYNLSDDDIEEYAPSLNEFASRPLIIIAIDSKARINANWIEHLIPVNISEEDILRCKKYFHETYYDELNRLGQAKIYFGVLESD